MCKVSELSLPKAVKRRQLLLKASDVSIVAILVGMVLVSIGGLLLAVPRVPELSSRPVLLRFGSYAELKAFLNESQPWRRYYYEGARGTLQPVTLAVSEDKSFAVDYSGTNIQVEGVDEADIAKCDGEYLYLASNNRVLIVRAYPPEEAKVVTDIELNGTVIGIYINKDRLVIFESWFEEVPIILPKKTPFHADLTMRMKVYDVEDRGTPVLVGEVSSNGVYFASRMIGDYVYVLVNQPAYVEKEEVVLPILTNRDRTEEISISKIYYANVSDVYYEFTTIIAVNVQEDVLEPTYESFLLGAGGGIYMSLDNLYLAIPRYDVETGFEKTEIHRFHIEGDTVESQASGQVPGRILNQFSMDEYQGHFRIATTTGHLERTLGQATSANHIYVLDMDLTVVGRLEDLAPGESIYSARFMGERCYLVTFKKVDPLFVVSLEDPANPKVLGRLKIPGYSDYLHPYDENHLIGLGKETVEAEEGDFAWYQGVKISLFDVSDVEHPKETAKYEIGDRGTDSPVLWDHKALLFDKERKLLAFPVLVTEIDEEKYPEGVPPFTYGDYVWQGVYVFTITEDSIALRGRVTHLDDQSELLKSGYYFDSEYSVSRALYIDEFLYTLSGRRMKINNLTNLEEISEIELR